MSKLRGSSRTTSSPVAADEPEVTPNVAPNPLASGTDPFVVSLAEAMDSMIDPMVLLRPQFDDDMRVVDFEYVDANQAALDYLQTTRELLIGSGLKTLQQAKGSGLFAMHLRTYESGEPLILEDFVFPHVVTQVIERYDVRESRIGDVLCFTWRDVTEREKLLEHYRLLAENASDVVFRVNANFELEWVSESVQGLQGFTPDDLIGRSLSDFCHPDDLGPLLELVEVTPTGEKGEIELRVAKAGGSYRWCSLIGRKITDDHGVTMGYVGSLRDIDAEHAHREAQRESDRRYRLLAENTSDVVMVSRAGGEIQWVSASVTALVGWRPEDLVGRRFTEFVHADDRDRVDEVREQLERGGVGRFTLRLRTADGSHHWIAVHVRDVVDSATGERQRVASWRDAEQEVQARETLVASESRFRLLAENATDIVIETDAATRMRWVSPSLERVLGWRPDEWVGHDPVEFIHADDVPEVLRHREVAMRGERTAPLEIRLRDAEGGYHWMSGQDHLVRGRDAEIMTRVIGLRGIDAEVAALQSMTHAESKYQMLAENASDVVLQIDPNSAISWISPSVRQVLGWDPRDIVGTTSWQFLYPEDRERVQALRRLFFMGETISAFEIRAITPDGDIRWLSMRPRAVRDADGTITATVMAIRDIHLEVLARRAITTLSAGSRALVRAQDERRLLSDMCEIATGEGGYAFAWYARKVHDDAHSVEKVAASTKNRGYLDEIEVRWDEGPLGSGPAGRAIRLGETVAVPDFRSDTRFEPWLQPALEHGLRTAVSLPVRVGDEIDGALLVYDAVPEAFDESAVKVLENLAAELGYGINRLREQERLLRALNDQKLLSSAIEQAAESVLILDPTFTILYANPSTVRTSGYGLDEIIGRKPMMFGDGQASREHLDNSRLALSKGESWHGVFRNRRKNGEPYEEDTTISPIHDESGRLVAYVEVKSDLTAEQVLRSDLSRSQSDQSSFIEVMRSVRTAGTVHATSYLFCEAASQLPGVDIAGVLLIQEDGGLLPISVSGSDLFDVNEERPLYVTDPTFFHRLEEGPITAGTNPEEWAGNAEIATALIAEGVLAVAFAPIRWEGSMIGVLALATKDREAAAWLPRRFGYFEEVAAYAGTLLGNQAKSYERRSVVRAQVNDVIEHQRFRPNFQPMVDLKTGAVVGYEALTRFDDGVAPFDKLLEAASVGLGVELEVALATAALREAERLPADAFLSLNFSPPTLLLGRAREVVAGHTRPVVIEITEHDQIDDYAAVRRAVRRLDGCVLAVDDAGAGYTSLSHILELRPRYVKLDISLVRDVDSNAARQAMVAGMCHFALQSGTILVAEGIETPAEADALRRLGVSLGEGTMLGQGFLFGRPAPLDS